MECWFYLQVVLLLLYNLPAYKGERVAVCLQPAATYNDALDISHQFQYNIVKRFGDSCYLLESYGRKKRSTEMLEHTLLASPLVEEAEISVPRERVKRVDLPTSNETSYLPPSNSTLKKRDVGFTALARTFLDPIFPRQWHLYNSEYPGRDLNVLPVWGQNITGAGVTVAILDDGVEYTHPDINDNYEASVSWDYLDNDSDPMPMPSPSDNNVAHGTRCAGQVAAGKNMVCGVGVAYSAKVAGIRMLKNKVEDAMEAEALKHCRDKIDIYSSSWGPLDDGKKMDGPGLLVRRAFEEGALKGRGGKGSIYVWASGNGGLNKDNCNCDGYCSSIYTISISAVNDKGQIPAYVEECSATLAAAFSSGTASSGTASRRIATTDLNGGCTEDHGGTSAAAPLAAGVIALALSANNALTWRDVQHLIVQSSSHPTEEDSILNGVGRRVNNKIGFGILNAAAMVDAAKTWSGAEQQRMCRIVKDTQDLARRDTRIKDGSRMIVIIDTDSCLGTSSEVAIIEHVQTVLTINHQKRGSLKISLLSPSGTLSHLLTERPSDQNNEGFVRWRFLTVHMWGEPAPGEWQLTIESVGNGELTYFELVLYGTRYQTDNTAAPCRQFSLLSNDGSGDVECVRACPVVGYYSTRNMCLPCHPTCHTCTDYNVCTSCREPLLLLYQSNKCVRSCPAGYISASSKLAGLICQLAPKPKPWYKGDATYIIVVVVFVTALISVVLVISMLHYRKYRHGVNSRQSPYCQMKPHLRSHGTSPPSHVTSQPHIIAMQRLDNGVEPLPNHYTDPT